MTAALDSIPRTGSTTPRVYTPPLKVNCTNRGTQHCLCGCGLNNSTSWGFDCIDFLEEVCGWHLLPWQKWLYVHALEKGEEGAGFRFKILLVMVARQNGKTRWLKGLGMWRLFMSRYGRADPYCPGARLAVIAAQNLDYAESTLKEVVDEIRDNPLLCRELINHRVTNGKHRAILTNRRYWRAATASRKGARSLSVDIAMLDELREHTTWDAWNAIVPTTTVRKYSQVVCTSNAGDQRSEVLRSLRDRGMRRVTTGDTEKTTMGYFEWSVPMDEDPRDPAFWHYANPAMGLLNEFQLEDLQGFLEAMEYRNMPGFQTEHLALDIETPVLTTAGWKTMAAVMVGDQVYHPSGHPVEVTHTTEVFKGRQCYRVETTDGRLVVADADHRWTINDRRSNRGWETLTTRQLVTRGVTRNSTGGRYAYRLPDQRAIVSKPVDLPLDPYVLGAWLGDGTATKPEITCSDTDVADLRAALGIPTAATACSHSRAWRIRLNLAAPWSHDGFAYRAKELGVWGNKHVPDSYLTAGTEQRLALLQGLMDTDGSIDGANRVRFCNTNRQIANSVLYLARSLGQRATLSSSHHGKAWMVCFTASEIQPFRLPRKATRITASPTRAGERTAISIRSIVAVDSRQTRCITVDSPDSLFLAGRDLVPTANCQWVDAMQPGIIPAEHWAETMDHTSRRAEGSQVYAALDVNYERSRSYVAIAARRADGNLHIEVAQANRGTDWVIPWLAKRKDKFTGVAIQKTGAPASGMIEDLRRAGVPVVEWGPASEVASGAALFYDQICQHQIYHRPAPVLDRAAASGISRNVGDGWVFDRRNSPVDISSLVACCGAVWLEHKPPQPPPEVHLWPDEDVIAQWEREAEERWPTK